MNGLNIPTDSSHRQIFFPCRKLYLLNDVVADLLRKHGGKTGAEVSIHVAAKYGKTEDIKQHVAAGADLNAKDKYGKTPLDWAIKYKYPETAALLRKHGGKTGEELKAAGN